MTTIRVLTCALLVGALLLGACGDDSKPAPEQPGTKPTPEPKASPQTEAELKRVIEELVAAHESKDEAKAARLAEGFYLPDVDGWFVHTFGPEEGKAGAASFNEQLPDQKQFGRLFLGALKADFARGRTQVRVIKITGAEDPEATGNQKRVLKAMVKPTPIYTVKLTEPGKPRGSSFKSFVYVDGAFRFVAKLKGIGK